MIEVVSWPGNLADWDPKEQPYYLELGGETSPVLDVAYSGPAAGAPLTASAPGAIYEYWWTIGHAGFRPASAHWYDVFTGASDGFTLWTNLREVEKNVAARVYLFFPRGGGWRIKELTAAVIYLTPIRERESLLDQAAAEWTRIQPYVSSVSQLAAAATGTALGGPIGGAAASRAVQMLSTLAKVQLTSVPQSGDLTWAVGKMTTKSAEYGVLQGIAWTIPKAVFELLGGRITGTVSLSVVPAALQQPGTVDTKPPPPQQLPALAHAVVYAKDKAGNEVELWTPSRNKFIELQIQPLYPETG